MVLLMQCCVVCAIGEMDSVASPARRSTRVSLQPVSLAEEQANESLSTLELRDVAAALRLSLRDTWESEEEKSDEEIEFQPDDDSEEEEEKHQADAPAEQKEEWMSDMHAIDVPLPRLRHQQQRLPPDCTPFQLLQCFLPPSLMQEFAQHTNDAAPNGWRPTTAAELYVFLGAHLFMGIDRLPRTEMYWSQTFGHPLLTQVFSRDRFKQLLRFFRVAAPDDEASARDPIPHIRSRNSIVLCRSCGRIDYRSSYRLYIVVKA